VCCVCVACVLRVCVGGLVGGWVVRVYHRIIICSVAQHLPDSYRLSPPPSTQAHPFPALLLTVGAIVIQMKVRGWLLR